MPVRFFHKKIILSDFVSPKTIEIDNKIKEIADKIIKKGILAPRDYNDALHLASSIVYECDYILSWNFKHIVNAKTQQGIKEVSAIEGYKPVIIWTPKYLLDNFIGVDNDD